MDLTEGKAVFDCKFRRVVREMDNENNAETVFHDSPDDLFDMAHQNAPGLIKIEYDRQFPLAQ